GLQFLRHLQRTHILLHLVDISPPNPDEDPVKDARAIAAELKKYSPELAAKERWLILNKVDLLPPDEAEKLCKDIVRRLRFKGPVFRISGLAKKGTDELIQAIMGRLEEEKAELDAARAELERKEAAELGE
ncbi:MAG: GTPase ObgE, partial [Steroidobacteraceae bacterium]